MRNMLIFAAVTVLTFIATPAPAQSPSSGHKVPHKGLKPIPPPNQSARRPTPPPLKQRTSAPLPQIPLIPFTAKEYALEQARKCLTMTEYAKTTTTYDPHQPQGSRMRSVTVFTTTVRYSCGQIPGFTHIRVSAVLGRIQGGACKTVSRYEGNSDMDINFVFVPRQYDNIVSDERLIFFNCVYSASKWELNNSVF